MAANEASNQIGQAKVTKANSLIEVFILEKTARLSLNDQRVVLSVISKISPEDEDFKDYQIPVSELVELTGISTKHIHKTLHDTCTRLITSAITIKEPSNPDGFLVTTWFSHAEYLPEQGIVEFSVSPRLKPYLLQLKSRFTTYHLSQVKSLQSAHAIRFYELFRQFLPLHAAENDSKVVFRDIPLADLRKYLGIRDKTYPVFSDFRKFVLERSQKDLSKYTDISFDFDCIRRGRKIHTIKFRIYSNVAEEVETVQDVQPQQPSLPDNLVSMIRTQLPSISDQELQVLVMGYSQELLLEALLSLAGAVARNEIKTTAMQFFLGVLKKKRQEEEHAQHQHQTTEEKLTDRSWAD